MNFKSMVQNFLVFLYFLSVLILFVTGIKLIAALPMFCVFLLLFAEVLSNKKYSQFYIFLVFSVGIMILFTHLFWKLEFYQPLYFFFCSISIAYIVSKYGVDCKYALFFYFLITAYFLFKIFSGVSLSQDVFDGYSRNFISIFMLFGFSYIYMSNCTQRVKLIASLVGLIVCILAGGRSGIISSLLVFSVLMYIYESKMVKWAISLSTVILLFYSWDYIKEPIEFALFRFEQSGFTGENRQRVLECYISTFNVHSLFLGFNSFGNSYCGTLAIGEYAPHNSLISLATNSGLFSFFIFSPVFIAFRYRCFWPTIFIVMSYVFRALTDTMMFYTFFDVFYWWFIFEIIRHRQSSLVRHYE
ncbi:hypothetical protein ACFFLG_02430 [Shewanella indica]|uniref:hypothetical protein n=1 Tax=Shewanella indica TaxID=768528 RepID=UPI000C34AA01|nr:hypothetical protein [Shewanella indica]